MATHIDEAGFVVPTTEPVGSSGAVVVGPLDAAAGREDLLAEHRADLVVDFATGDDGLRREIRTTFHAKTAMEWMQIAVEHDIAMGPALRFDEIQDDPHLGHREELGYDEARESIRSGGVIK